MHDVAAVFNRDRRAVSPEQVSRLVTSLSSNPARVRVRASGSGALLQVPRLASVAPSEIAFNSAGQSIAADVRIDNVDELARELGISRAEGLDDAALLLGAYAAWGMDGFAHVLGDFACVIWDERADAVIVATDAFAVRPLYFSDDGEALIVGSRLSDVASNIRIPSRPNLDYFRRWMAKDRSPCVDRTPFAGIEKVPPAHAIEIKRDGRRRMHRYYVLGQSRAPFRRDADYVDAFSHAFRSAVRARLAPDGNTACLGGGGIDSSSIVAAVNAIGVPMGRRFPLHAAVFTTTRTADEREYLDALEAHCRAIDVHRIPSDDCTALEERALEPIDPGDAVECWPNPNLIARLTASAANRGTNVVLVGDFGDAFSQSYHLPRMVHDMTWPAIAREWRWFRPSSSRMIAELILGRAWAATRSNYLAPFLQPPEGLSFSAVAMYFGVLGGPASAHLVRYDALDRSVGVETRFPYLDRRVADVLVHVPADLLLRNGFTKTVVRQGLGAGMPPAIAARRTKVHFTELALVGVTRRLDDVAKLLVGSLAIESGAIAREPVALAVDLFRLHRRREDMMVILRFRAIEMWLRRHAPQLTL